MSNTALALAVPVKKKNFLKVLGTTGVLILFNSSANAADNITALGADATSNISAALTVALAIFAVGIGIIGTFKGYQYLKSGVTKA